MPVDEPRPAPPEVAPVVALQGVGRRFGTVDALRDLDLVVPANRITVLLGPNGAGKTTAIRMITGALDAHSGTVSTFGMDPREHGEEVRLRCGVVSAKPALYDRLDGHANLSYAAELYGLGRGPEVDRRIREAAGRFGIEHALDQRVGGFSTGMKTRLALARSILHQPDLLPWPGYWFKMLNSDRFVLAVHDQLQKHWVQRRVMMRESWVTLPLETKPHLIPINETIVKPGWQDHLESSITGRYRGAVIAGRLDLALERPEPH